MLVTRFQRVEKKRRVKKKNKKMQQQSAMVLKWKLGREAEKKRWDWIWIFMRKKMQLQSSVFKINFFLLGKKKVKILNLRKILSIPNLLDKATKLICSPVFAWFRLLTILLSYLEESYF